MDSLSITSGSGEFLIPLDFAPLVIDEAEGTGLETWVFEDLVASVDLTAEPRFDLIANGVYEWHLENITWLDPEELPSGQILEAEVVLEGEGGNDHIMARFSRSIDEVLHPAEFQLIRYGLEDEADTEIHLAVERIDSRTVALVPLSGGPMSGRYELHFLGGIPDRHGRILKPGRIQLEAVRSASGAAGLADASLASTISLILIESPAGSGLLSAYTSGSFTETGYATRKSFEIELESGDQLSVYMDIKVDAADYFLRVENASGVELTGGVYGTPYPLQRVPVPTAGTYRVQAYVNYATTDFELRIDVGRNLYMEAENNDTQAASNPLTFKPASGGYQESAAGALSDLKSNSSWGGSNDVNGDFFDLGTLSAGNTVDVVYQFPSSSTLAAGDLEFALFASGAKTPAVLSTSLAGLSTTIPSSGHYFLRIAADDNLDGTCLRFNGGTDRVDLPPAVINGLNVFTMEFWARGRSDTRGLVSAATASQTNEVLVYFNTPTQFQFYDKGTAYSWTVPPMDLQTWRHYAIVRNGGAGTIELFVDGVSRGSLAGKTAPLAVTHFLLGQDQDSAGGGFDPNQAFIGNMDDFRIWNTARTASEILDNQKTIFSGAETGLVAYFRYNEGSGSLTIDETANAWEGSLLGVVFDGDTNAAGFNPAKLGMKAQYYSSITVIDSVQPTVVTTSVPEGTSDGYHTHITVTFTEDLDPETAGVGSSYDLRAAGADATFDTADDEVYTISPLSYARGVDVELFLPDGPLQPGSYRFRALATIEDRAGNALVPFEQTFTIVPLGDFIIENRDNNSVWKATNIGPVIDPGPDGSFSLSGTFGLVETVWAASLLLDDDAYPDFISINNTALQLEVYLNNGDGTFTAGAVYPLGDNAYDAVIANLDGSGKLDVAVAVLDTDQVRVFLNNGDGTLSTGPVVSVGNAPRGIAAGDLDGNGMVDLITSNSLGSTLTLLSNTASGTAFTTTELPQAGTYPNRLVLGQFDGIGGLDVVYTDNSNKQVVFLSGNGDGTFGVPVFSPTDPDQPKPTDLESADFDHDGIQDLVVAYDNGYYTDRISILFGNGDGTYGDLMSLTVSRYRSEVFLADFNNDGHQDLLVGTDSSLHYFLGTGERTVPFQSVVTINSQRRCYGTSIADFDLDGRVDFIVSEPQSDTAFYYTGNPVRRPLSDATATGFYQALGRGNLRDADDVDFYAFSAKRGEGVSFVTENGNTGDPASGLTYNIYNPGANSLYTITSSYTGGRAQSAPYIVPTDGTYYLRVTRNHTYLEEYRFRLTIAPTDYQLESEDNNATTQADPLVLDRNAGQLSANVLGQFMPGDTSGDFYDIGNLAAATVVDLSFFNTEDSTVSPKLWLYRRSGNTDTIVAEEAQGVDALNFTTTLDGAYFAKVSTVNEDLDFFSEYRLEIVLTDADPPTIISDTLPAEGSTTTNLLIAFTLNFNEDLYAPTVTDPASFEFRGAGADELFLTADDFIIALGDLNYVTGLSEQLAILTNPLQPGKYRFTAFSGGIEDLFGNSLQDDYVREFSVIGLDDYLSEDSSNDSILTADPLTTNPPGGFTGSHSLVFSDATASDNPQAVGILDVNGDEIPDLAVTSINDDLLRIYFGNGDGSFADGPQYALSGDALDLAVTDLDGDGFDDLALAVSTSPAGVKLFRNNQDGTLGDLGFVAGGVSARAIAASDLDGQFGIDLVVANYGTSLLNSSVSILLQQEDGSFVLSLILSGVGLRASGIEVADFDGDTIPDLAVADYQNKRTLIAMGNGDGTFAYAVSYALANFSVDRIAKGDFDQDNDVDLAISHISHTDVSLLLNNGDGTFAPFVPVTMGNNQNGHIEVLDLNNDTLPDLVQTGNSAISWRYGQPGGDFSAGSLHYDDPAGADTRGVDVADLNQDGLMDLVTVGANTDVILVYLGDHDYTMAQTAGFPELQEVFARGRDIIGANNPDYYVFTAKAGQQLLVNVGSDISNYASHNFQLYDHWGNQIFNNTLYNGFEQFGPYVIPFDGNYYFRAIGNNNYDDIYRFRLSLVDGTTQPETENNNNYNSSDNLTFSEAPGIRQARVFAVAGATEDSSDWFGIGNLAENAQITVTFTQPDDSGLTPTLSLRANNGSVTRISGAAGATQITYTLNAGEEAYHWVVVTFQGQNFRGRYFLDVSIEDLEPPAITGLTLPAEGATDYKYYVSGRVSFSEDLQPVGVTSSSSYELTNAGPDNTFGTEDDFVHHILPKAYTSGLFVDFIIDEEPLQPGHYRFRIPADALKDLFGNPLAEDFVREFYIEGLVPYIGESLNNGTLDDAETVSKTPNSVHDGSFLLENQWSTTTDPRGLLALDVDDDEDLDAIVAGGNSLLELQLLRNDGSGAFGPPENLISLPYPDQLEAMSSGDFNGDGRADVVLSVRAVNSAASSRVIWLGNNGDGTFTELTSDTTPNQPGRMDAADLNDDGYTDLVVVERAGSPKLISVFLNDGTGEAFARGTVTDLGAGADPTSVVIGDFDTDEIPDLIVTDYANQSLLRFKGAGDGTFAKVGTTSLNTVNPLQVALGDFDDDGMADVVVTFNYSNSIEVLRGNGDLTFNPPVSSPMREFEYQTDLLVGDFNGDTLLDILVGTRRIDGFTIFSGQRGAGYFLGGPQAYAEPKHVSGLAAADFDGDGRGDILISDYTGNYLALYRGTGGMPLAVDSSVVGLRTGMMRGTMRNGETSADYDYWTFSARAGDRVFLTTENTSTAYATGTRFQIMTMGGDILQTFYASVNGGVGQSPPLTLDFTGRLILELYYSYPSGDEYRVNVNLVPAPAQIEVENNDNSSQALSTAPVFESSSGSQEAHVFGTVDRDDTAGDHYFLGNLAGGTSIQVRLTLPDNSLLDPRLQIYRAGNPPIAQTTDSVPALDATVSIEESGAYYARIDGTATTRGLRGTYLATLRLLDIIPPEITGTSLPVEPSAAFFTNIKLTLNEDFDADAVNDPDTFELRDAGIDGIFDSGDDVVVPLGNPAYTGGYTVTLPLPDNPLPAGQYRLTARSTLKDEFENHLAEDFVHYFTLVSPDGIITESVGNDSPATATALPLEEISTGLFYSIGGRGRLTVSTEKDYWVFSATAGQQLVFDTDFPGSNNYSSLQFLITAPDGTTTILDHLSNRNSGFTTSGAIVLAQTGNYIIRVDPGLDSYTGEYQFRLSLADGSIDWESEVNDSTATADSMTLVANETGATGAFYGLVSSAIDRDYVSLGVVTPGNTIFLSALPYSVSPLVPVVSVYRVSTLGEDVFISEVSSGRNGDGVVEIDVTEEHEYFALVRGSSSTGGLLSLYQLSAQIIPTDLANFPNLQVTDVTLPVAGNYSSGDLVSFSFTVTNVGADPTEVPSWIDRVAISTNNIFGDGDDYQLAVIGHAATLGAGESYTVNGSGNLPEGISGSFFLIVRTDTADQVDEFLFEGDNELASGGTFTVSLSDYPDLVIENLVIPEPNTNGDITITWQTVNRGSLGTSQAFVERVEVVNRITGGVAYASSDVIANAIPVDGAVERSLSLNGLVPSNYRVRIRTDFENDYFEFGPSGHATAEENYYSGDFIVYRFFTVSTFSSPVDGGTTTGSGVYQEGSSATVTAIPDTSTKPYRFVRWKKASGALLTTDPLYNFVPTANIDLVAEFELPIYTIAVAKNITAAGSVSGAGGYRWGSAITVRATPSPGYLFERFENASDNSVLGTNATLPLTVTDSLSILTIFAEKNPSHNVTVGTNPAGIDSPTGTGSYVNGEVLNLSVPPTIVDLPTEYIFQQWTLNNIAFSGSPTASKTFTTLDPPAMAFVAKYASRNYNPVVTSLTKLVSTNAPIPAGTLFGVSLTFDRAMDTGVNPVLTLVSGNAAVVPIMGGGRWLNNKTWESGTLTFISENTGDYILRVSAATGSDGRTMDEADVLTFTVDATPPPNPVLELLSYGSGTATVGWNGYVAPPDLNNFRIYLKPVTYSTVVPAGAISSVTGATRQFKFNNLTLDTDYYAAVVAVDKSGNANESVVPFNVRIDSDIPPPVSVSLSVTGPDSVVLDWNGYSTAGLLGFKGFMVFREAIPFSNVTGLTPVAILPPGARTFDDAGLDRTLSYNYAVVGYNRLDEFEPAVTTVSWSDPLAGEFAQSRTFGGPGQSSIDLFSPLTVTNGATLTFLPGTTLYFASGAGITVESGRLIAQGTALDPIVFTSANDDGADPLPQAGDWDGIRLLDTSNFSILKHVWVLYGSGVEVAGADPQVGDLGILENSGPGLAITSGATFTGSTLYIAYNETGVETRDAGSTAALSGSVLFNNALLAAMAGPDTSISATGNWWGTTDPAIISSRVDGSVDTSSFLLQEPLLGVGFGLDSPIVQTTNSQVDLLFAAMNAVSYRVSEDSAFAGVAFSDLHPPEATRFVLFDSWLEAFTLSEGSGSKTIFAEFLSPTGGLVELRQLQIELLSEGPSISGWSLTEGALIKRPLIVNASAASPVGIKQLRMEVNGVTVLSTTASAFSEKWNISSYASGIYRLRLVAEDLSGNIATRSINVTIDPNPPAAPVITAPANNTLLTVKIVDISGTAEAGINLRVTVNGSVVATGAAEGDGTFGFTEIPLLEGSNQIVVTAFDDAGSSSSSPLRVDSDTLSPLPLVLEDPLYDPETGLLIQWRYSDAPGERPVRYKVFWHTEPFTDPAEALGASPVLNIQNWTFEGQPNQDYYFRVVGYDSANNASPPSNQVTTFFDDTPPIISISYLKPMPVGAGPLVITLVSNERLKAMPTLTIRPAGRRLPISVVLDEVNPTTWQANFIVSDASMDSGTAEVIVNARDLSSNLFSGTPVGPALVVDLTRPTGVLRMNVDSPKQVLAAVQIELTLELSEPVMVGTTPSLRWSPPSPTYPEEEVPLTGSEDVWTATLTLFPEMGKGDGLFLMQATDVVGNVGTLLTQGATFEIYNTLLPAPPGPPPMLLAKALPGGGIQLNWQEAYRAVTYNVYRVPSSQEGLPNVLVKEGVSGLQYIDLPPADGQYRYVVKASRYGAEGSASPSYTITSDRTPPPPPENIAVNLGTNGVMVTFDAPSSGEIPHHYVLYRNGAALITTTAHAGSMRDYPPRGVMEYQVASSDAYGNHSLSDSASIEMFLGPVKDVQVLVEPGQPVRLSWVKTDPITEGYNLYRNGARQNGVILSSPSYSDPLSAGNLPVEYAITAVNAQAKESARRVVVVQPAVLGFLLNVDEAGLENNSVAGYFDSYSVTVDLAGGDDAVSFSKLDVARELETGTTLTRSLNFDLTTPAGGKTTSTVVIPSPKEEGYGYRTTMTAKTQVDAGGGFVRYRASRLFPGALVRPPAISLTAKEQPLAGGLTDFSATFTNWGRTEADFVMVRKGGAEPGEFSIRVLDTDDQEVSVTLFENLVPGLTFNSKGDGFFRLAPGGSATITVPSVFVPIALADTEGANFVGQLENLYYRTGSALEDKTGPLKGGMKSGLAETPYYGTSSTARGIYSNDEVITITGQSLDQETDEPVGELPLRIGFEIQGFVFYEDIVTDSEGNYSYDFTPTTGIGGSIHIWAAHPDVVDQIDQTSVVLYRSLFNPARGNIKMSKNDHLDFQIQLINVGDVNLTGFQVETKAYTIDGEGNQIENDSLVASLREPIASPVGARKRVPVKLRLTSTLDAPDNAIVEITLVSDEGARSTFTAGVALLPAYPILDVVSPRVGYVDLSLNKGEIISRQVTITNSGLRPLEGVKIQPPKALSWMQLNLPVGPDGLISLPDLPIGDSITFTVVYTPPEDTPIGYYDDFLLIKGTNAVSDFRVNLFAQVGSSEVGNLEFDIDNNLVLPIPNASVRLRNVTLGLERGPSFTDSEGHVRFDDLQEGKWSWTISAPSHQSKAGVAEVIANQTVLVDERLGKSLVSIKFSVVPVPFTDRYEIKIEQTFETRVPVPVIVYDPPKFDFEGDEPFEINVIFTLTNHGLISVFDVEVQGSADAHLRMTPLIEFLPELKAQQTVEIPAKITFSGFGGTLSAASLQGAGLQAIGGEIPSPCGFGDWKKLNGEFLEGIAAIARMAANGGYQCADGDLGTVAAVALASASAYKAITEIMINAVNPLANLAINIVGKLIGCIDFGGGGGGGGSGGGTGPSHNSGPRPTGDGRGCFAAGTMVTMVDGALRPIETLRAGDEVLTGTNGSSARIGQSYTLSVGRTLHILLRDGNALQTTPDHRVWVDGAGWKSAESLQAGDWLKASDGSFQTVESIRQDPAPMRVYTFQLEGESAFFANGILVEDLCGGQTLEPGHFMELTPLNSEQGGGQ